MPEEVETKSIVTHIDESGCPMLDIETFGPEVAADPHPFYGALRDECPVVGVPFGDIGSSYIISRHEDVKFALRNHDIFSSEDAVDIGQERPLIPLQIDPPEHVNWRRMLDPYFGPHQIAPLEADIRTLVNEIVDVFVDDGEVNFHSSFSVPVPCTMFLRLLGCPIDEMDKFVGWKDNIIRPDVEFGDVEGATAIRRETGRQMYEYFADEIAARRSEPRDDLLTKFVNGKVDGRPLTENDILDILYLFLLGGLDTVTASLDCIVSYLAVNPDRRRHLVENPDAMMPAIEEFLRFHTPVMGVLRAVKQDIDLHGISLHPGDTVMLMLGAANTDETVFEEPGTFQIDREDNKHFTFGGGPHRCLGSHFARLELRVALEEFHRRIPDYEVAPGVDLTFSTGIREVAHLPLVFPANG